jgi:hypothetical protein
VNYLDFVEGDPLAHVLLEQPLKQPNNLSTFGARFVFGAIVASGFCRNAIQAHELLYIPILCTDDAIQGEFMVAFHTKGSPPKQKTVKCHTQCPDIDRLGDGWTMRRRRLKYRRRIGLAQCESVRRGKLRYLRPKVKDDLRCEEGRSPSRLTEFRIIEKKLQVGVRVGLRRGRFWLAFT